MLLDHEKVLTFLPHRDPFLFVDTIESVRLDGWTFGEGIVETKESIGTEVVGHYYCREDHPIFEGHFPGKPILPGVVQVEMMAQGSSFSILTVHPEPFGSHALDIALMSVSNAKFRKPVLPGMNLVMKSRLTKYRGTMMACDCMLFNEGTLMSEVSVLASIRF